MAITVTPKEVPINASLHNRTLQLPAWETLTQVEESYARKPHLNDLGPTNMLDLLEKLKSEEIVDISGGDQLRFGASFLLFDEETLTPWFVLFDEGHPTRPLHLTPAGGIVETLSVRSTAYHELAEEFILLKDNQVGRWRIDGVIINGHSHDYAKAFNLRFNEQFFVDVKTFNTNAHWKVNFGKTKESFVLEFEPDTSSIEFAVTGTCTLPAECSIVDGERSKSGEWLQREIHHGISPGIELTSKAQLAMNISRKQR